MVRRKRGQKCDYCPKFVRKCKIICRECEEKRLGEGLPDIQYHRAPPKRFYKNSGRKVVLMIVATIMQLARQTGASVVDILTWVLRYFVEHGQDDEAMRMFSVCSLAVLAVGNFFAMLRNPKIRDQVKATMVRFITKGMSNADAFRLLKYFGVERYPTMDALRHAFGRVRQNAAPAFDGMLASISTVRSKPTGRALTDEEKSAIGSAWIHYSSPVGWKGKCIPCHPHVADSSHEVGSDCWRCTAQDEPPCDLHPWRLQGL